MKKTKLDFVQLQKLTKFKEKIKDVYRLATTEGIGYTEAMNYALEISQRQGLSLEQLQYYQHLFAEIGFHQASDICRRRIATRINTATERQAREKQKALNY